MDPVHLQNSALNKLMTLQGLTPRFLAATSWTLSLLESFLGSLVKSALKSLVASAAANLNRHPCILRGHA